MKPQPRPRGNIFCFSRQTPRGSWLHASAVGKPLASKARDDRMCMPLCSRSAFLVQLFGCVASPEQKLCLVHQFLNLA